MFPSIQQEVNCSADLVQTLRTPSLKVKVIVTLHCSDCICLTFLHCAFSNVASNCLQHSLVIKIVKHHLGHVWGMSETTSGANCQQWTIMDNNLQCYMHLWCRLLTSFLAGFLRAKKMNYTSQYFDLASLKACPNAINKIWLKSLQCEPSSDFDELLRIIIFVIIKIITALIVWTLSQRQKLYG